MTGARRRFRPRPWPTVTALVAVAVLIGLGVWQLQRLTEKLALIAAIDARIAEPPIALPTTIADPAALEFASVRLRGRFVHDKELYLGARTHGGAIGFHVIAPLVLDDGRAVLVDRGWVPSTRRAPESRAAGQIAGEVTVDGQIRAGGWKGSDLFRPANQPAQNLWLWMDLPAMAAHAGLTAAETSVYVVAGPAENPGGVPIGAVLRPEVRNDHFGYAMTWFVLAAAMLVVYVVHQGRPRDDIGGP
jgi:surfeit locus 1 family protein